MKALVSKSRNASSANAGPQLPAPGMSPAVATYRRRIRLAAIAGIACGGLIAGYVVLDRVNADRCHLPICGFEGGR